MKTIPVKTALLWCAASTFFYVSCTPSGHRVPIGRASEFVGYRALSVPRGNAPLGAEWIHGVGPNGRGTDASNIEVDQSVSTAVFTRELKQDLDASLLDYLEIRQNASSVRSVEYEDLMVYRVKDVASLSLVSGQSVLYEYLKAGSISIQFSGQLGAEVEANLGERAGNLEIDASAGGGTSVKMSGENMILAYRVLELGKPQFERRSAKFKASNELPRAKVFGYDVTVNGASLAESVRQRPHDRGTGL